MKPLDWTLLALLGFCFAPALFALAGVWSEVDYYSHGFLVPVVSAWVAWQGKPRAAALGREPDPRAGLLLAGVLALYVASLAVGSVSGQGLALVGAVASAVWWLGGRAWLRLFAFPLAYLLFMVPLPPPWLTPLIVRLQLFVSEAAVGLAHALAVPVSRAGNVIWLPEGEALFVAEACSGVTSVVTLTPLAVLLAYLVELPRTRAVALVAAVIPLAMAANLVRVVATVLAAHRFGTDAVTREPFHSVGGLAVYVLACLALLGVWRLLAIPDARVREAAS